MGSAYTTIAVDTAARFQRLAGRKVTFVTGTDEHGEKIAAAAAANGLSPQEHCDSVAAQFRQLWQQVRPLAGKHGLQAWAHSSQSYGPVVSVCTHICHADGHQV